MSTMILADFGRARYDFPGRFGRRLGGAHRERWRR